MWQQRVDLPEKDILSCGILAMEAEKNVSIDGCQCQNKFPCNYSKRTDLFIFKLTLKTYSGELS